MERNVKGFTLAELMGVIVLLAIIAIIVVPVVDRNLKKGKTVTCKTQEKSVIEAAKNYSSDAINVQDCESRGQTCKVTIRVLVQKGYLEGSDTSKSDAPPINPATGEPYDNSSYVQILNATGYNYSYTLMYEGKDKNTCKE